MEIIWDIPYLVYLITSSWVISSTSNSTHWKLNLLSSVFLLWFFVLLNYHLLFTLSSCSWEKTFLLKTLLLPLSFPFLSSIYTSLYPVSCISEVLVPLSQFLLLFVLFRPPSSKWLFFVPYHLFFRLLSTLETG